MVLSRFTGERIMIGDDIKITVVAIRGNCVRIGIEAPDDITIVRPDATDKGPRRRRLQRGLTTDMWADVDQQNI